VPDATAGSVTPDRARRRFAVAAAACAALVVAAYANSFRSAFQFDDENVVVSNVYIRSLANVPRFFADARTYSTFPPNMAYRPLVSTSLALDYAIGRGLAPGAFRATQLVLLLALGALLAALWARILDRASPGPASRWAALAAATLFCVHVVNTEAMNLMHVRSELLSAIGIVAAFLVHGTGERPLRRWLAIVPVALGALAKIPAVLFAPLLLAHELVVPGPRGAPAPAEGARLRRALRVTAPSALAAVVLYAFVERAMRAPTQTYGGASAYRYALTQAWAWVQYLRLFFVPAGLTADTDLEPFAHAWDTRVVVGLIAIAALAAIVWRTARHPRRWPIAFGVAWFMISLLPASSVLPLAEVMNEHRPFLAYMGLSLAVVWAAWLALDAALDRWRAPAAVRTALPATLCARGLAAHAVGVHVRNRVWRTHESLWADVTAKSPENGRAWMNYGVALMANGAAEPARSAFLRAQQLTPGYSYVEVNLGVLEGWVGNGPAAERHFRRALELGPSDPASHEYYAGWLVKQGRAPEALPLYEAAVRVAPGAAGPRARVMELRAVRGDGAAAAAAARELLAIEPGNARARALASGASPIAASPPDYATYLKIGLDLGAKEQFVDSALAYRAALALQPGGYDALNNLGWTLGKLGFFEQAVPVLERAVRAGADAALARGNLEWVRRNVR